MTSSLYPISLSDLKLILENKALEAVRKSFKDLSLLIACKGYLGNLAPTHYSKYYKISLMNRTGESILIDIPKQFVDNLRLKNDMYICATGILEADFYQNRLSFRLDVTSIELLDPPEVVEQFKREQISLAQLKTLGLHRQHFPYKSSYTLDLIFPISSQTQVKQDFLNAVNEFQKKLSINYYPVNMLNTEEIGRTICQANADIIVIIRGGGETQQFEIFNNKTILTAFAKHSGYRICGLGHSGQFTLLDMIADYAADTPTAAGHYLCKKIKQTSEIQQEIICLKKYNKRWKFLFKCLSVLLIFAIFYIGWLFYNLDKTQSSPSLESNIPTKNIKHVSPHRINRDDDY